MQHSLLCTAIFHPRNNASSYEGSLSLNRTYLMHYTCQERGSPRPTGSVAFCSLARAGPCDASRHNSSTNKNEGIHTGVTFGFGTTRGGGVRYDWRYVLLAKVASRDTQTVIAALIKQAKKLPDELYKSLTWDRGKELSDHKRFTMATDIDVYFCDPPSPWQRGSNENTNGLLRQYFPKRTDLSPHSQAQLNKVARQLNERPRKTLVFETPAERFYTCVASTG